jgi:hypothetical protein
MSKPSFQDIVPPAKKTIRDIPISLSRKPSGEMPPRQTPPPSLNSSYSEKPPKSHRLLLIVFILIIIAGLVYAGLIYFGGATLKVTPKQSTQAVNLTITATKDSSGGLRFSLINIEKTGSEVVQASSSASIQKKAMGDVIIYNNYSSAPQALVKSTRLATQTGLIYRIQSSVTVPGTTSVNGKTVPGSVAVTAVADQAGDTYNIGASSFTIPGFQSDPQRYAGFYAQSKNPMAGGFIGIAPQVPDASRTQIQNDISSGLKDTLTKEAGTQTPDTFVFYPDGIFIQNTALADSSATGTQAANQSITLNEKSSLYGIIFSKDDLAQYIASKTLSAFDPAKDKVAITNIKDLVFSLQNKNAFSATSTNSITFTLTGNATIVWQFDQTALKQDLAGKSRSDFQSLLASKYPAIDRIQLILSPFWQQTFPTDTKKIIVDIVSTN